MWIQSGYQSHFSSMKNLTNSQELDNQFYLLLFIRQANTNTY